MLKLMLSVVFVGVCTMVGYSASLRLRNRKLCLQAFLECVHRMKPLISFSGYDIDRVIGVSFGNLKGFEDFQTGKDSDNLYSRWTRASSEFVSESKLKLSDKDVILRFGENLGVTDTEGQLMNCDLYCELISELVVDAKDEEEKKSKLYRVLGFSLGTMVTLLIL